MSRPLVRGTARKAGPPRGRAGSGRPAASLTETAYLAIKEEILAGRLAPGEPIPIERFTAALSLSRTPVREAILRLEREGLIEIRPRLGTFVSRLDTGQIREMYEVRRLLEGQAAALAAGAIDGGRLAALRDQLRGLPEADLHALSEAGERLHALVAEACPNRLLARMILSLRDHFRRFRSLSPEVPEQVLHANREHLAVADALSRGDGECAARLMDAHLRRAARSLLDNLGERNLAAPEA